jgi:hypothetical protein
METRSAVTIGRASGLLWVAALVAGCGGDGGDGGAAASCGKVAPCGGSLVGTFAVSSSCESPTNFTSGVACAAATIDESQVKVSGLLTFNADMTFATTISQSGTLRFSVPLECLSTLSGCDELAGLVSPGPPDATTTCTTTNAACLCTLVYAATMTASSSGTYTTAGTVVSLTDDAGYTADTNYCVQTNTLHLVSVDPTTGEIIDDVVAARPGRK